MDEMKCEWSGVKNVARTGIPFIKLDRISVLYAVGLFATFESISFTGCFGRLDSQGSALQCGFFHIFMGKTNPKFEFLNIVGFALKIKEI